MIEVLLAAFGFSMSALFHEHSKKQKETKKELPEVKEVKKVI